LCGSGRILDTVIGVYGSDWRPGSRDNPGLVWARRVLDAHFLLNLLPLPFGLLNHLILYGGGVGRLRLLLLQQALIRGALLRRFVGRGCRRALRFARNDLISLCRGAMAAVMAAR
jgi:hypothetical protein